MREQAVAVGASVRASVARFTPSPFLPPNRPSPPAERLPLWEFGSREFGSRLGFVHPRATDAAGAASPMGQGARVLIQGGYSWGNAGSVAGRDMGAL